MKWWLMLLCIGFTSPVLADSLDDCLAAFAREAHRRAHFVEDFSASYLKQPIVSEGELEYRRPDELIKRISKPQRVIYTIRGNTMTMEREGKQVQLDLSRQPEIGLGIAALQHLLAGDRHALEEDFRLHFHADKQSPDWRLVLEPFDDSMREKIDRVIMQGRANHLQQVKIEYANGDTLLTRITDE